MKPTGLFLITSLAVAPFTFAQVTPDSSADDQGIVVEPGTHPAITAEQRMAWFAKSTFGPVSLFGGAITSAIRTGLDHPQEYGTHWEGFGDRYGIREAGSATSNAIEASLGAAWHEDPRYFRAGETAAFKTRVGHIVKWTFVARNQNDELKPAYARYIAVSGTAFLSNTWRVDSEANSRDALERIGTSFLTRMAGNTFKEFTPDLKRKFFHRPAHD